MKINFKQPKYVLPVILLPFLCFFFYVWKSGFEKPEAEVKANSGLNSSVGNVSADVQQKQLADKLETYRNAYREAGGNSAVGAIPGEVSSEPHFDSPQAQVSVSARSLDSIDRAMKHKFRVPAGNVVAGDADHSRMNTDPQLAGAIAELNRQRTVRSELPADESVVREKDPMEVFKQQMAYMDSIGKANDPEVKAAQQKKADREKIEALNAQAVKLPVSKGGGVAAGFNTVLPEKQDMFISAVIDENVTGYAGSRIRLKLLEDIHAGETLVPKGTYLYARITGFNEQRVALTVSSIMLDGRILPVKLQAYDLDGMAGLFVPSSAFREFTKDLGSSSVQGVTLDGGSGNNQFIMSTAGKFFQSTSSAIAELIRKNKARLKYHSYLYLIDNEALQNAQKKY
ncbi:conjugative transposon protein TraM [Mucilaginibacter terrae]|uniref:Conjugative transposon TraM protein n=1 Tax=Mucilaginibacter terrae TaxID=1955052 RepID=A0ABU3GNB5_9SPHI|nr:conjugative transposon protein TraM [Mucilaginibacter terrae]MDT3401284.1 conjugative transposon TraM protein [Mucilaginibacter terrae]